MKCISCKQNLPTNCFCKRKVSKTGFFLACKECQKYKRKNNIWPCGTKDFRQRTDPIEKQCKSCNEILPIENFTIKCKKGSKDGNGERKKDVRQNICRKCLNKKQMLWRKDHNYSVRKAWIDGQAKIRAIKYLSPEMKCHRCGIIGHFGIYDFHHTDPQKKESGISELIKARYHHTKNDWNKIYSELDKCILLCRNCHSIIHCAVLEDGSPNPEFESLPTRPSKY